MPSGGERCINSLPRLRRLSLINVLMLALVGLSLLWAWLLFIPAPAVIETNQAGGQIYFSANRQVILNPGDCVTLRWQVDGIQAVYLNGQAQIGSGEAAYCIREKMPRLDITFQNGSQQTYTLNILTLTSSPLTWGIIALALLVIILNWRHTQFSHRRPAKLFALLAVILVIVSLLTGYLIPNSQTISSAGWLEASTALVGQITGLTACVVLTLVALTIVSAAQSTEQSVFYSPTHSLIGRWGIGFMLAIGLVAGTIVTIDALGMYFGSPYPSHQLLVRGLKTDGYNRLSEAPDIAIMGSSRAFTLDPRYINDQTGYTAYNMAVEGGRIEDILIQARQLHEFPKVLLIEIQEGFPRQPNDIAARAPLRWLPYMSASTALLTLQTRLEGLLDVNQFAQAIYTARYAAVYRHQPKEWPEFAPDGTAMRPPISASELERAILIDIGNIPPTRCDQVVVASRNDISDLLQIANEHHTSLIFYLSPWHPHYYDALLKDDPQYQTCHDQTVRYMQELSESHTNLFFLDYSHLESIGGTADESGYYDSQHLTAANSQRLFDHMIQTLRAAIEYAEGTS